MYNVFIKNNSICSLSESYSLITEYNIINEEAELRGIKKYLEAIKEWFKKLWKSVKDNINVFFNDKVNHYSDLNLDKLIRKDNVAYTNIEMDIAKDTNTLQEFFYNFIIDFDRKTLMIRNGQDAMKSIGAIEEIVNRIKNITKNDITEHVSVGTGEKIPNKIMDLLKNQNFDETKRVLTRLIDECTNSTDCVIRSMERRIGNNSSETTSIDIPFLKKVIDATVNFSKVFTNAITNAISIITKVSIKTSNKEL